jgi:hypothetical protein
LFGHNLGRRQERHVAAHALANLVGHNGVVGAGKYEGIYVFCLGRPSVPINHGIEDGAVQNIFFNHRNQQRRRPRPNGSVRGLRRKFGRKHARLNRCFGTPDSDPMHAKARHLGYYGINDVEHGHAQGIDQGVVGHRRGGIARDHDGLSSEVYQMLRDGQAVAANGLGRLVSVRKVGGVPKIKKPLTRKAIG